MAFPELQLIGRWTNTNASTGLGKAANTQWSPPPLLTTSPALPQGLLNGKQVGEVALIVVYSPVTAQGAYEDLAEVQLVLDGKLYPYVFVAGRQDVSMAPPRNRIRMGKPLWLGMPTFNQNGKPNSLIDATCPKFVTSATVNAIAGPNAVTQDYTVELWGYVYPSAQLASMFPSYNVPDVAIPDKQNNRVFTVKGITVSAGDDWRNKWKTLPAGDQQGLATSTPVYPLVRRARNANATTASQGYRFQYQNSSASPAVEYPQDNLFFDLSKDQALLVKRLGVVGPAAPNSTGYDLLSAWLATPSEQWFQAHPNGGAPVDYNLGELRFGLSKGETNKFDGLPDVPGGPYLVTNETAYPTVVDNGTSVPALDITVGFHAVLIGADDQGIG